MKTGRQPEPQQFADIIGAFILNFGAVEMATFLWILKLTTGTATKDSAINQTLGERIKLVVQLIENSNMTRADKDQAKKIWAEADRLRGVRNKIAHSPIVRNPKSLDEWGIIDVKKMKGIGPFQVSPLRYVEVATAGKELARILPSLLNPVAKHSGPQS